MASTWEPMNLPDALRPAPTFWPSLLRLLVLTVGLVVGNLQMT